MTFNDAKAGDELFVLNGRQNSVFEAKVVHVGEFIVVQIPEKGTEAFVFDVETGEALEGKACLVTSDDWRVQVILARKAHALHRETMMALVADFYHEPTDAVSTAIAAELDKWRAFVKTADRHALVTRSIHEYVHFDRID